MVVRNNLLVGNAGGISAAAKTDQYTMSRNLNLVNNVLTQQGGGIPGGAPLRSLPELRVSGILPTPHEAPNESMSEPHGPALRRKSL